MNKKVNEIEYVKLHFLSVPVFTWLGATHGVTTIKGQKPDEVDGEGFVLTEANHGFFKVLGLAVPHLHEAKKLFSDLSLFSDPPSHDRCLGPIRVVGALIKEKGPLFSS